VFGLGSYKKFYGNKNKPLILLLQNLIITRHLIFLGFSLDDEHFMSLMTAICRRNESYIILPISAKVNEQKYLKLNITPIFVDQTNSDPYGINSFLAELLRHTYTKAYN